MAGRQPFQRRAHPGVGRPARAARVTGLTERPGNAGPVRPGGWYEGHDPFLPVDRDQAVMRLLRANRHRERPNVPGTGQYQHRKRGLFRFRPAKPRGMARLLPWRAGDLLAGLGALAGRRLALGGNG